MNKDKEWNCDWCDRPQLEEYYQMCDWCEELDYKREILEQQVKNQKEIIKKQTEKIIPENHKLYNTISKAITEVKELYEMAKEQDSDNVNLIDRLELILKILGGEDNEI